MSVVLRLAFGGLACAIAAANAQTTVLRFGSVVDATGRVVRNATVVVEGDRVVRVTGDDRAPVRGATEIDLRKYTAIPGLIDLHTHMTYYWDQAPGTRPFG